MVHSMHPRLYFRPAHQRQSASNRFVGRRHSRPLLWRRNSGRIHAAWPGQVHHFWTNRRPRSCPLARHLSRTGFSLFGFRYASQKSKPNRLKPVLLARRSGKDYLRPTWTADSEFLSRTIDFFSPANRISISVRDPSEFTRSSAASLGYWTPFFTQAPCAVAKNCPSFQSVTRTIEFCDSQLNS